MNANDIIIDLLEDNRRRLQRAFNSMADECVYWKPDPQTNDIALTVWHMARMFDVFLTQQTQGRPAAEECWFRDGWAARSGYDPRGVGMNGWGMVTGYTQAEAANVPRLEREQLLGYLAGVYDAVRAYVEANPIDDLLQPAVGFEGKYSRYQCIQMALMDNVRHLGEIYALKNRWEREVDKG